MNAQVEFNPQPKKSVILSKYAFNKLKKEAYIRDSNTCQLCGCFSLFNKQPHHIIPKGRLHLDVIENLLTVHFRCHRKLHDGLLDVSVDDLIEQYRERLEPWLK